MASFLLPLLPAPPPPPRAGGAARCCASDSLPPAPVTERGDEPSPTPGRRRPWTPRAHRRNHERRSAAAAAPAEGHQRGVPAAHPAGERIPLHLPRQEMCGQWPRPRRHPGLDSSRAPGLGGPASGSGGKGGGRGAGRVHLLAGPPSDPGPALGSGFPALAPGSPRGGRRRRRAGSRAVSPSQAGLEPRSVEPGPRLDARSNFTLSTRSFLILGSV